MKGLLGLIFCLALICMGSGDRLVEQLHYQRIHNQYQFSHFTFEFDSIDNLDGHSDLFPPSLYPALRNPEVSEVHVSLTQGRWWFDKWGANPMPAPPGGEVWAAFSATSQQADEHWLQLVNTLSGVLGASFTFLTGERTVRPPAAMFPRYPGASANSTVTAELRMGQLPRETACAENVAPLLLLTPCRGKAGLGAALSPQRACGSDHMSIGFHFVRNASSGTKLLLWAQTVERLKSDVLPGLHCAATCPAADSATVFVDQQRFTDCEAASAALRSSVSSKQLTPLAESPLVIQRSVRGGAISYNIQNIGDYDVDVRLFDPLPWFVRLRFANAEYNSSTTRVRVTPTCDHCTPGTVEAQMTLAPQQSARLVVHYEVAFLHIDEYPPDPRRGFDVGAAWITWTSNNQTARVNTIGGVISVPTPDFSMPFNVAALTATAHALLFGSVLNVIMRRFVSQRAAKPAVEKT
eukprot:TRINITY_DN2661_c0_g1_i1.p1 TRINITY_DN2661_c0_g1~~TRINITY_DN2661_c0_g1_i1.p1  ORF type:complete len:482 (-),score=82.67 TRINITY_DN2661_c0_g1_i1:192-1586(-)